MKYDQSYGVVPLQKRIENGKTSWQVFLVRHRSGHWTLPKGHPEQNETPLDCAKRELFEETGLKIEKQLFDTPLVEEYEFLSRKVKIHKTVHYFIAEVYGTVSIQLDELQDGKWVELSKAHVVATYPQMKKLLNSVSANLYGSSL